MSFLRQYCRHALDIFQFYSIIKVVYNFIAIQYTPDQSLESEIPIDIRQIDKARIIRWLVLIVLVLPIVIYCIGYNHWRQEDFLFTVTLYVIPTILASFYAISWFSWWFVKKEVFPTAFRNIFKGIILLIGWAYVLLNNLSFMFLLLMLVSNSPLALQMINEERSEEPQPEYSDPPQAILEDNPSQEMENKEKPVDTIEEKLLDAKQRYSCEHWIVGTVSSQLGQNDTSFTFDIEEGDEAFPAGTTMTIKPAPDTVRDFGMKGLQWGMDGVIIGFSNHSENEDSIQPIVIIGNDNTTGKYWENK